MMLKDIAKRFIPKFLLNSYHFCWALLGAVIFGFPGQSKAFKIIGITGTSGKSTTSDFTTRILEEPFDSAQGGSGNKVASISTIRFKIGEKEWENKYKMTMPGRFVIQKFLKQAKDAGCNFIVLEVTSQGIEQYRHKFINFDTAVFTNLGKEHIESHGGFENYRNEKIKLFQATKNIHVINIDDENAKYFLDIPANKKISFSLKNVENINTENEISFNFNGMKFNLNLIGEFNIYNALAAISIAKVYGISLDICKKALEKAKGIPGRMGIVSGNPPVGGPKVIVDYAHTPEQLEGVYKTLDFRFRGNDNGGKLICVLGSCGGGRDKWKRPVLGEIAKRYCDKIFITNEDPYDENLMEIINQVAETAGQKAEKILDRKEAIKKAIKSAQSGDTVIITGKGSEPWMCVKNDQKIPWDDRKIAREALNDVKTTVP